MFSVETIGVRELRQNASRYLELVKDGETIEVTERGTLVALLVPPSPARLARDRLLADGRLRSATGPRTFPIRRKIARGSPDGATVLEDLRRDSR